MHRGRMLALLPLTAMAVACGGGDTGSASGSDLERGKALFQANCAVCHGPDGQGTTTGPPLVHEVYEPGHHNDESFHRAVTEGSPAHHWEFGDMPPVAGLDRDEVDDIIAWVRQAQREAGIG